MRTLWILAGAAATFLLVTQAAADTVYLKDGRSFWGQEAYEEGGWVILVRPDGTLRFPKDEVSRIQPAQTTLPRFYEPPSLAPAEAPGAPRTPPGPAGPAQPGTPPAQAPGAPAEGAPPAGAPAAQTQVPGTPEGAPLASPPGTPAAPTPLQPPPAPPFGGGMSH
jgi:hypothetical protein